jgi:hypothetical protein
MFIANEYKMGMIMDKVNFNLSPEVNLVFLLKFR